MSTYQIVRWSGVATIVTGIFGIIAALGAKVSIGNYYYNLKHEVKRRMLSMQNVYPLFY